MASFQTDLRAGPLDLDTSKHKIVTNIMLKALISTNHQFRAIQNWKWSICSCLLSQATGYKNLLFQQEIGNLNRSQLYGASQKRWWWDFLWEEEKEKIGLQHGDLWSCLVTWCVHRDCTLELGDVWETLLIHHIISFYSVHMLKLHAGWPCPSETYLITLHYFTWCTYRCRTSI